MERLYYEDAYLRTFEATLLDQIAVDGRTAARLDRSAFYPTSGGQQNDLGTLDDIPVIDVQAGADGAVLHFLRRPLPPGTKTVTGVIDWPRRFDHMQQHSGQHLLSGAFVRLFGLETVSVHFGDVLCTLDLDTPDVTPESIEAVERHANEVVWENRSIRGYWVDEADVARLPLRRPPQVSGRIRIVEIEGYDWSACGGTHVRRTGEIGPIVLLRTERHRGRSRVHFLCGRRALVDARRRRQLLAATAALLDTAVTEVPDLVAKQQERLGERDREIRRLRAERLQYRAGALLAEAGAVGEVRLVARAFDDLGPADLKTLATILTAGAGVLALLGCAVAGKGTVIFARSADVEMDVGRLLRSVLSKFGGGGGGRANFAQGGGVDGSRLEEILTSAVAEVV